MTDIPWPSPDLWQQANTSFQHHLQIHGRQLDPLRRQARAIADAIAILDPIMSALCAATCHRCQDICCRRATVWFDFKDLLFLHLTGTAIAPSQPKTMAGNGCRYLGPWGCRLPRQQRPLVCTWYLCPAQKQIAATDRETAQIIQQQINTIKKTRLELELSFIGLCWPHTKDIHKS